MKQNGSAFRDIASASLSRPAANHAESYMRFTIHNSLFRCPRMRRSATDFCAVHGASMRNPMPTQQIRQRPTHGAADPCTLTVDEARIRFSPFSSPFTVHYPLSTVHFLSKVLYHKIIPGKKCYCRAFTT